MKLTQHVGSKYVKVLYLGDSGVGKTGSLASLVPKYNLRILDLDNGLPVLVNYIKRDHPDRLNSVDYETRRDAFKSTPAGPVPVGVPKAFVQSMSLMNKWSDDTIPQEWGPEYVFVLDSLTGFGNAAFEWAKAMNPGVKDPRQWYNTAQRALEQCIGLLTNDNFKAHVIIIAHVQLQESPDGTQRGYANCIGKALGPIIPTYMNTMVLAKSSGIGGSVKRSITTVPTSLLDLKNPKPFIMPASLPLESGLADIFRTLTEDQNVQVANQSIQ